MSLVNFAPLAATLEGLQRGQHSLSLYLEQACRRIDQVNPQLQAMLPEPGRLARLRAEAGVLREQHPDRANLPPLYGALLKKIEVELVPILKETGMAKKPA